MADENKAHDDHQSVQDWVHYAEMNQIFWLLWVQLVNVLVQTAEVQQNYQEGVKGSYRMVRLSLFNVTQICVYQKESLSEFDVVEAANQIILTASKAATKVENAEAREQEFANQNDNCHLQEKNTSFQVESLYAFELLYEISLFFHKTSLFFGTMRLHFSTDLLQMFFAENILLLEKVFDFLASCKLRF